MMSFNAKTQPDRILIIKPSALGDVVTAMPVLRGLRRTFPQARISWLISNACAPLIAHDSQLDEIILFERRKLGKWWRNPDSFRAMVQLTQKLHYSRFDWVLDLQGLFRSGWFTLLTGAELRAGFADARELAAMFYNHRVSIGPIHTVDRNIALLRSLGVEARGEDMRLEISPAGKSCVENFCKKAPSRRGNFLVVVPPTTWPTKLYPVRHWRKVVSALSERIEIVLAGSPSETVLCNEIAEGMKKNVLNLSGKTTVDEFVGLISASAGVICCDSAAKFIAPAVGVDCVTLIGPTQVQRTGPYLKGRAIIGEVPCQGCLKRRCSHVTCMQMIDPDDVVRAAEKMLSKGLDA